MIHWTCEFKRLSLLSANSLSFISLCSRDICHLSKKGKISILNINVTAFLLVPDFLYIQDE